MIVTGLQPTGSIHIGNYLGAIKPLVELQQPSVGCAAFIADYHAITSGHDPVELREHSLKLAAMIIAGGFDPVKCILFRQSDVPAHTELGWILSCTSARVGWLNRMTQYREKSNLLTTQEIIDCLEQAVHDPATRLSMLRGLIDDLKTGSNAEGPSVGLYSYPVLQAADILLYQATEVPVGEDQMQHLNLVVDIAEKFNREFGQLFTVPRARMTSGAKRIMSLIDPLKKMSKSDPNDDSRINIDDDADAIARKFKRATSDSDLIPHTEDGLEGRHGLGNMLSIYSAFTGKTISDALLEFGGKGFGVLKPASAQVVIEGLRPIQEVYFELLADRPQLVTVLNDGADRANDIASGTLDAVRQAIGVS